jgi:hypothetical protein
MLEALIAIIIANWISSDGSAPLRLSSAPALLTPVLGRFGQFAEYTIFMLSGEDTAQVASYSREGCQSPIACAGRWGADLRR